MGGVFHVEQGGIMSKCLVCKAQTVIRQYGTSFFVMCESNKCRARLSEDGVSTDYSGAGRPLSSGLTPAEAEAIYAKEVAQRSQVLR